MIKTFGWADIDREKSLWELQRMMAKVLREDSRKYGRPLPVGGGTSFSGVETLTSMPTAGPADANNTVSTSLLTRDVVIAIPPQYFSKIGASLRVTAHGIISTTGTPTVLFQFRAAQSYANPLTGNVLAGSNANAALTTGSGLSNAFWWIDLLGRVDTNAGNTAKMLMVGKLQSSIVSTTDILRTFSNATPPTAVSNDFSVSNFFDLTQTWGTASASNTLTCNGYVLESLN